ncbi:S41 family peptidase [Chitinophaga sp. HK235]|uniref:S41 family peptidase n=1 Tax=Chitinophaga sp. HK235 TaxID=2952571 RepID=UPI001BAC9AB0|nr:S41 family peptidase [Chitinophaga sp. HK235]
MKNSRCKLSLHYVLSFRIIYAIVPVLMAVIMFGGAGLCHAQTLVHYMVKETDTVYEMKPGNSSRETAFFFPNYDEWKQLETGYVMPADTTVMLSEYASVKDINKAILYLRVHSVNISKIKIRIDTSKEELLMTFIRDGYQFPDGVDIGRLLTGGDQTGPLPVHLSCEPVNAGKPMSFILGEMMVCSDRVTRHISPVGIFQQAPFANASVSGGLTLTPFDSYGNYIHYPAGEKEEASKAALVISDSTKDTRLLLGQTLLALLDNYPFYTERRLIKEQVLQEVKSTIDHTGSLSVCEMVDTLNRYLLSHINDPHFFIRSACATTVPLQSPLQVYSVNGSVQVAAVMDDTLRSMVPPGSRIRKINGTVVREDASVSEVNRLLRRKSGEQVTLTFLSPAGKEATVTYRIADKYRMPANMMPANLAFRKINDSTTYYKINRIDARLPTDFASRLDSINSTSRLVIDLRGCGGGDLLAGATFLSYIIHKPFRYFDLVAVNGNATDSVMVRANPAPFHYRDDGRIILLVDKNTACTAELLIHNLKTWKQGTQVWGKEETKGALAIIHDISMPDGRTGIGTNALGNWKILLDKKSIEGTGIRPDNTVLIEKVNDLQPYEDKVLQMAIRQ